MARGENFLLFLTPIGMFSNFPFTVLYDDYRCMDVYG